MKTKLLFIFLSMCIMFGACSPKKHSNLTLTTTREELNCEVKAINSKDTEDKTNQALFEEKELQLYGRIVDQDGYPVRGASVRLAVQSASSFSDIANADKYKTFVVESDENGCFGATEPMAMAMGITDIAKPGMEWIKSSVRVACSARVSDKMPSINARDPVLLMMLPDARVRPVSSKISVEFVWNGGPVESALGSSENTLKIDFKRNRTPGQAEGFDWSVDIAIEGGSIQEFDAAALMLAPDVGYHKWLRYNMDKDDPNWNWGIGLNTMQVYRTADGEYGTLELYFNAANEDESGSVRVVCHHNPTGERYLR